MTKQEKQINAIKSLTNYPFYLGDFRDGIQAHKCTEEERSKFKYWKDETKKLDKMTFEEAVNQCKELQNYTDDIKCYYINNEVRMLLHCAIHGTGRGRVK